MEHIQTIKDAVNHLYWSLVVQGIIFLLLAILIVLYPALLIVLVATMFAFMGLVILGLAIRLRQLWGKLPKFLQADKR